MLDKLPRDIENMIISYIGYRGINIFPRKRCWAIKSNGRVCKAKNHIKHTFCSVHQKCIIEDSLLRLLYIIPSS